MSFRFRRTAICLVLGLSLVVPHAASIAGEQAMYELTFDATWSPETHPVNFPPAPHFSGLIGATHTADYSMWSPGAISSDGIESMAESGGRSILSSEIRDQESLGHSSAPLLGPGIGNSPDTRSMTFEVDSDLPLLSMVSMIAPSPDWFVGVHDFDLRPNGEWVGHAVLDLDAYDAGTDSGPEYVSRNDDTQPPEPIHRLTGGSFLDTPPLGTFELLRIVEGDLNRDALLTVEDLDLLSAAVRANETDTQYDLNRDGSVNSDDRIYWLEDLKQTVIGDSNLDGLFDNEDFVFTFVAGQYNDEIPLNSGWGQGDWDGNGDFDEQDVVFAFTAGTYTPEGSPAAAVPEPSTWILCVAALGGLMGFGRRRVSV